MRWISLLLAAVLAPVLPALAQAPPAPSARFVVVLDAAHGGTDPGGRLGDGQPEKLATLALSVRLRSLLGARGIPVITTRESDVTLTPDQRAAIANRAKAQVCLILHATESGAGIHLFTSSLAPAKPQRFLAWKTAQSAYVARSIALAGALNSALLHDSFNVTLGRTSLPGLDSMTCPAVAVEVAPQRGSGNSVTAEPDNPEYQAHIASALATAILAWRSEGSQP